MSHEKWSPLVKSILSGSSITISERDMFTADSPLQSLVERFSEIFIWNYGQPVNAKQNTYRLQLAVDDILSFIGYLAI